MLHKFGTNISEFLSTLQKSWTNAWLCIFYLDLTSVDVVQELFQHLRIHLICLGNDFASSSSSFENYLIAQLNWFDFGYLYN